MRRMFLRLTELGETTEDTRRRVPLAELIPEGEGSGEATEVLEQLAAARLLVVGDDSAEIAHEALIREWPRLRGWLGGGSGRAPHAPAAGGRGSLVGGERTRRRRSLPRPAPGGRGRAGGRRAISSRASNASSSRRAGTRRRASSRSARRRARRLRGLLAGVAAALVVAVIAGSFALVQRGSARRTATVGAGRTPRRPVARGCGEAPRPGAPARTRGGPARRLGRLPRRASGALEHGSRIRAWLQGFDSPVVATAFSPGGTLLATATIEGTTLWDTTTWKPVGPPLRSSQGGWSGCRLQPGRADAGDRGRQGPRRAVGRVDQEGASGADGPGGGTRTCPRSPSFDTAPTAASSPQARWRRTTSRCGQPRAVG